MNATESKPVKTQSAIRRVSFYVASPVECCDRCSQGIKYVTAVTYRDGAVAKFGLDCINKVLSGDTSLKALFAKNNKLLIRYKADLEILSLPVDQLPKGEEYFGAGFHFIKGSNGRDMSVSRVFDDVAIKGTERVKIRNVDRRFSKSIFHPDVDVMRNAHSNNYAMCGTKMNQGKLNTVENYVERSLESIAEGKEFLAIEINRLELFLARILNSGLITSPNGLDRVTK